eukprot:GHVP01023021.1.p1 GENE.GHVP01023021.1~~GHVP01023021.1.p1  ORF type:complete len:1336 (-),score=292.35 GHVP01023021.1:37-4044(-)
MRKPRHEFFGIDFAVLIGTGTSLSQISSGITSQSGEVCLTAMGGSIEKGTALVLDLCSEAIAAGDGRELFVFDSQRNLHHPISELCAGFDIERSIGSKITLQECTGEGTIWSYLPTNQLKLDKNLPNSLCLSQQGAQFGHTNVAYRKTATCSHSLYSSKEHDPSKAVDGDPHTYFVTQPFDFPNGLPKSVTFDIDLEETMSLKFIEIDWEFAATDYRILVSEDNETWKSVKTVIANTLNETLDFIEGSVAKIVRLQLIQPFVIMPNLENEGSSITMYGIDHIRIFTWRLTSVLEPCGKADLSHDARDKYFFEYVEEFDPAPKKQLTAAKSDIATIGQLLYERAAGISSMKFDISDCYMYRKDQNIIVLNELEKTKKVYQKIKNLMPKVAKRPFLYTCTEVWRFMNSRNMSTGFYYIDSPCDVPVAHNETSKRLRIFCLSPGMNRADEKEGKNNEEDRESAVTEKEKEDGEEAENSEKNVDRISEKLDDENENQNNDDKDDEEKKIDERLLDKFLDIFVANGGNPPGDEISGKYGSLYDVQSYCKSWEMRPFVLRDLSKADSIFWALNITNNLHPTEERYFPLALISVGSDDQAEVEKDEDVSKASETIKLGKEYPFLQFQSLEGSNLTKYYRDFFNEIEISEDDEGIALWSKFSTNKTETYYALLPFKWSQEFMGGFFCSPKGYEDEEDFSLLDCDTRLTSDSPSFVARCPLVCSREFYLAQKTLLHGNASTGFHSDSAICLAALHAGVLNNGYFLVKSGDGRMTYGGEMSVGDNLENPIYSTSWSSSTPTAFSLIVESFELSCHENKEENDSLRFLEETNNTNLLQSNSNELKHLTGADDSIAVQFALEMTSRLIGLPTFDAINDRIKKLHTGVLKSRDFLKPAETLRIESLRMLEVQHPKLSEIWSNLDPTVNEIMGDMAVQSEELERITSEKNEPPKSFDLQNTSDDILEAFQLDDLKGSCNWFYVYDEEKSSLKNLGFEASADSECQLLIRDNFYYDVEIFLNFRVQESCEVDFILRKTPKYSLEIQGDQKGFRIVLRTHDQIEILVNSLEGSIIEQNSWFQLRSTLTKGVIEAEVGVYGDEWTPIGQIEDETLLGGMQGIRLSNCSKFLLDFWTVEIRECDLHLPVPPPPPEKCSRFDFGIFQNFESIWHIHKSSTQDSAGRWTFLSNFQGKKEVLIQQVSSVAPKSLTDIALLKGNRSCIEGSFLASFFPQCSGMVALVFYYLDSANFLAFLVGLDNVTLISFEDSKINILKEEKKEGFELGMWNDVGVEMSPKVVRFFLNGGEVLAKTLNSFEVNQEKIYRVGLSSWHCGGVAFGDVKLLPEFDVYQG